MENLENKKKRGGARPGAGRPRGAKAVMNLTIACPQDIADILKAQTNRTQYVFDAIRFYERHKFH